ncbi:hypothetical protein SPI_02237 [Niveomyces insectorum RCEF 264]|uniref:Uncharacterized protein n=1 Tax=Niveomyces insectorum RCEF 264 TaxID=1081102 RepID=A0A162MQY1_9HYPO|nr:hypothetical protein SPI_02237 [Niveomyces insectorum RCEF 264]
MQQNLPSAPTSTKHDVPFLCSPEDSQQRNNASPKRIALPRTVRRHVLAMHNFWLRAFKEGHLCSSCRKRCLRRPTLDKGYGNGHGHGRAHVNSYSRRSSSSSSGSTSFYHHVLNRRPTATTAMTAARAPPHGPRSTRRKVGASEVFTAFYTTIMATAAVVDAGYKDRRRKDLDQRLDAARQDLDRVLRESYAAQGRFALGLAAAEAAAATATTATAAPLPLSPNSVVEGIRSICVPLAQLREHIDEARQREAHVSGLHNHFGAHRQYWRLRPAPDVDLHAVAAALVAEEDAVGTADAQPQREPQSATQFAKMVKATNELVDALLVESHRVAHPGDPAAAKMALESLDSPWTATRLLRSDGYPKYRMPTLDPVATAAERRAAAEAAWRIFDHWAQTREWLASLPASPSPSSTASASSSSNSSSSSPSSSSSSSSSSPSTPISSAAAVVRWLRGSSRHSPTDLYNRHITVWVYKLCYNLLVSGAPPGIHNYNALLFGFTRVGQHSLAQVVVDSFLYQTHLQPTQQTLVCLLHHYRARGDLVGFYRMLRRLVALDARGAKLRRRTLADLVGDDPTHLRWARTHDVAHAATVFAAALAETGGDFGRLPTSRGLVESVLDAVDGPAARVLVAALAAQVGRITALLQRGDRSARTLARRVRLLLAVASAPEPLLGATAVVAARPIAKKHNDDNDGDDDDVAHRLARALFVADTQQYLMRLNQIVTAAHRELTTDAVAFMSSTDAWAMQFDHLRAKPARRMLEQEQYYRMAQRRAVDEAAGTVLRTWGYLREAFMDAVADVVSVVDVVYGRQESQESDEDEREERHEVVSMAWPPYYQAFLRQRSVPFHLRFESYRVAYQTLRAAAAAGNNNNNNSEAAMFALLARHINVDAAAVGDMLEAELKVILLQSLQSASAAAVGSTALDAAARAVSLDTLLAVRAAGPETEAARLAPWATRGPMDFVSRYPYGLFRLA